MHGAEQNSDLDLVPLTDGELELEFSEMEAISVKTLLLANGIEAITVGASQMPNLPYHIHVPSAKRDEAVRIFQDAQSSGALAAERDEAAGEAAGNAVPEA